MAMSAHVRARRPGRPPAAPPGFLLRAALAAVLATRAATLVTLRQMPMTPPDTKPTIPDVGVEHTVDDKAEGHPLNTPVGDHILPQPEMPYEQPPPSAGRKVEPPTSPEGEKTPSATDPLPLDDTSAALASAIADEEARSALKIREITAPSCPDVCRMCLLEDAFPGPLEGRCHCFAECQLGADPDSCSLPAAPGWSNAEVTAIEQEWTGNCGSGDRDCKKECVDEEFLRKLDKCKEDAIPADCLYKLKALYDPLMRDRSPGNYCSREHFDNCEIFHVMPRNESNEWHCWNTRKECEEGRQDKMLFREMEIVEDNTDHSRDHLSVWHSLRPGRFRSED